MTYRITISPELTEYIQRGASLLYGYVGSAQQAAGEIGLVLGNKGFFNSLYAVAHAETPDKVCEELNLILRHGSTYADGLKDFWREAWATDAVRDFLTLKIREFGIKCPEKALEPLLKIPIALLVTVLKTLEDYEFHIRS